MQKKLFATSLALALSIPSTPVFAGNVLTVGGSGNMFASIQSAVNAAADGDTILVRAADPTLGFTVDGKSLVIVADGGTVATRAVELRNLQPGQTCLLSGFDFSSISTIPALNVHDNAGAVRCEAVTCAAYNVGAFGDAARVSLCPDIAFVGCSFTGSDAQNYGSPGAGLTINGSHTALYDCAAHGGHGYGAFLPGPIPPGGGASACRVANGGWCFTANCQMRGGSGGSGFSAFCGHWSSQDGAPGGAGLAANTLATAYVLDCQTVGGLGGTGGAGDPNCGSPSAVDGANGAGTVSATPVLGRHRSLAAPRVLRELHTLDLTLSGVPGEIVELQIGPATRLDLALPSDGVFLVGNGARHLRLGTVPASGVLHSSLFVPDLGLGVQTQTRYLQAVFHSPSNADVLSNFAAVALLDQAF